MPSKPERARGPAIEIERALDFEIAQRHCQNPREVGQGRVRTKSQGRAIAGTGCGESPTVRAHRFQTANRFCKINKEWSAFDCGIWYSAHGEFSDAEDVDGVVGSEHAGHQSAASQSRDNFSINDAQAKRCKVWIEIATVDSGNAIRASHRVRQSDAISIIDHAQPARFSKEKRKIDNRALVRFRFRKIDMSMNNMPVERIFVARIVFDPLRRRDCREKEKRRANLNFSLRQRKMHPQGSYFLK